MKRAIPTVLGLLVAFLSLSTLPASDVPQKVANPGFEEAGPGGMPLGWQALAAPAAGSRVVMAQDVSHSGHASLRIAHAGGMSTAIYSDPVSLKVGHIYRVAAFVRTDSARTDREARYPTPVAACLTMKSFPFTNHSPALGASQDWQELGVLFIATQASDRIGLHLGYNGAATGTAWFDDVRLEEVEDISAFVAPETVERYGPAFRFTDRGWTCLHIEGKPYTRGFQHGYLMAPEIAAYMEKLAVLENVADPASGWRQLRGITDALLLRQYEEEYLLEMRGMADGMNARKTAMKHKNGAIELLDIVAINSAIDLGQLGSALFRTANPLSGREFPPAGEEQVPDRLHKCSGIVTNGTATVDSKLVFFQMFMWNGYTGVSFNVICDVVPENGHRLVYETFPGGIHSGTDFYLNDAGIMIGETTVQQTPFDITGLAQSDRIRKAAQYSASVDDVVRILTTRNNGLYTNDWLIGDAHANEVAVLLQGTHKYKLWRSRSKEFPGETTDFYWCVNNAKDPEVRKEYIPDPQNAPFDLIFSPSNRDIAMYDFFRQHRGKIDVAAAIGLMASSPVNRPHACDGKVTSGEMASEMVFLAHFGKTTLREKIPGETPRMPALPDAVPHLTLGYSAFSPKVVAAALKAQKPSPQAPGAKARPDYAALAALLPFPEEKLWSNTVFPASDRENWFVSATASYHGLLRRLPAEPGAAETALSQGLAEMNCRLLFLGRREGDLAAVEAKRAYDRYGAYQIPRIRGTFLLHQLRLAMGNDLFSRFMKDLHREFQNKPLSNAQFSQRLEKAMPGLAAVAEAWLQRRELPAPSVKAKAEADAAGKSWTVTLDVTQPAQNRFRFWTTVCIETEKKSVWLPLEVKEEGQVTPFTLEERPIRLYFNAGNDIPVAHDRYFTFSNFTDNFATTRLVYGTSREIEAFHTLGLKLRTVLADTFSEILPPLVKDSEITRQELEESDLILIGGSEDNRLTREVAAKLGIAMGKNWFSWNGQVYGHESDGLVAVFPSPFNPKRSLTLVVANGALQLWQMVKGYQGLPSWALFRGERVVERGFHAPEAFRVAFD